MSYLKSLGLLLPDRFFELCELSGLNVALLQGSTLWKNVYAQLDYQPVPYLLSSIDYQLEYQRGLEGSWNDFSCVIFSDKSPVALWPITISKKDGSVNLNSQGRELLPPIFIKDCPRKTIKVINASVQKLIGLLSNEIGTKKVISAPVFDGSLALTNWHSLSMKCGAKCHVRHDLYVDLSLSLEEIRSFFRKSYKSLVTSGQRLWSIEVLSFSITTEAWEEFRSLHLAVAGRATRSKESWDLQYRSVRQGESFVVTLRDVAGKMVGAGLFVTTRDEGSYAVGAYDRSLFDKPLGHIVQFRAIQEMKERGCLWYFIGRRFYLGDQTIPSEKELSISDFKEGFSTHIFPSFSLIQTFS